MLRVAITGNIAAGKSVVEGFIREMGYKVFDTDEVAHGLLKTEPVKKSLLCAFSGFDILDANEICRKKLGGVVFEDEELRHKLEGILHPLIKEEINNFFIKNKGEKIVFVSVPLLFEAKFDNMFDKIILIYADDDIRLDRLINNRKMSMEHAKNRIKIQQSQDLKRKLSDYVLYNNGTLESLKQSISIIVDKLVVSQ